MPLRSSPPSCSSTSAHTPVHFPLILADNSRSSYAVDPQWQRKFSIIWAAGLAIAVLGSAPHIVRSLRNGRLFRGLITGVSESPKGYTPPGSNDVTPASSKRRVGAVIEWAWAWTLWTIPGVELDLGQSTSFFAFQSIISSVLLCSDGHRGLPRPAHCLYLNASSSPYQPQPRRRVSGPKFPSFLSLSASSIQVSSRWLSSPSSSSSERRTRSSH